MIILTDLTFTDKSFIFIIKTFYNLFALNKNQSKNKIIMINSSEIVKTHSSKHKEDEKNGNVEYEINQRVKRIEKS